MEKRKSQDKENVDMSDVGVGKTQFSIYFQLNRNYVYPKN